MKVNADFIVALLKLYLPHCLRMLKLLFSAQMHELVNTPFVSVSNSAKTKVMCDVQIVGFVHLQSCFMHMCVFPRFIAVQDYVSRLLIVLIRDHLKLHQGYVWHTVCSILMCLLWARIA
jgi:hypothetical protein